jgi:hypothetical protein
VPAPHTGEVISDVLHDVRQDWQMEKKVSTVTLDNCTTNNNLIGAMKDNLPLPSLMLHGKLLHMHCAAHIINLIVKDGMTVMDKGIERVCDSVGFWSATSKRHERFERTAEQMNIKYEKRIALRQYGCLRIGSELHGVAVRLGFDKLDCVENSLITIYSTGGMIRRAYLLFKTSST